MGGCQRRSGFDKKHVATVKNDRLNRKMSYTERNCGTAEDVFLSIIIPAYNEEKMIEKTLSSITDFLNKQDYTWEVIVVDDASTDGTVEKITKFTSRQPDNQVRLLVNKVNSQKGATICRGIMDAQGKYVVFLDADYAFPVNQVPNFINELGNGAHIVIGDRTDPGTVYFVKPSSFSYIYQRYLLSRVFNMLVRLLLVRGIHDTQCGMKAFQTDVAKTIFEKMRVTSFAFDVEILHIAQQNGGKIVQIPVTFDYIDEPSSVKLFRHSLIMFQSLIQIKLNSWMGRYRLDKQPGDL